MNTTFIIQLIASIAGTLGFAILFKLRPKHLVSVSILGGCCYAAYYVVAIHFGADVFIASLVATAFVAIISEVFARVSQSPALVFLLPGLIPIVPGGDLYNMMKNLITKNSDAALGYGISAIKIAAGVAGGIVIVSVMVNIGEGIGEAIRKKKKG